MLQSYGICICLSGNVYSAKWSGHWTFAECKATNDFEPYRNSYINLSWGGNSTVKIPWIFMWRKMNKFLAFNKIHHFYAWTMLWIIISTWNYSRLMKRTFFRENMKILCRLNIFGMALIIPNDVWTGKLRQQCEMKPNHWV